MTDSRSQVLSIRGFAHRMRQPRLSLCFLVAILICRLCLRLDAALSDPVPGVGIDPQVLLELDLKDTGTIEPKALIKQCSSILSAKDNKLTPDQSDKLHLLRANALIVLAKYKEALEDLEHLIRIHPDDSDIVQRHAATLANSGRLREAFNIFQNLIVKYPNNAKSHLNLANFHLRMGDSKKSLDYCNSALAIAKNDPLVYYDRSCVYTVLSDYKRALEDLNKCIELGGIRAGDPDAALPYASRAAMLLCQEGVSSRVLSDLLIAKKLNPNSVEADGGLWGYYFLQGKYKLASQISKRMVQGEHPDHYAYLLRAVSLINQGEIEQALPLIDHAIIIYPQTVYGHLYAGHAFFALGQYEKARTGYDKALLRRPNETQILGSLSYLLSSCPDQKYRNGPEALKMAQKCCDLTANRKATFIMLLACAEAECGHYDRAVQTAEKALKLAGPDFHLRKEYERRRDLFRGGKPFRYTPGKSVHDYLFF